MNRTLVMLGGRLLDATKRVARREGSRRPSGQVMRAQPPAPRFGGQAAAGLLVGKVVGRSGTSRNAVYSIQLADGSTVQSRTPRRRGEGTGAEFDIRPAAIGTPCFYSIERVNGVPTVILHSCEEVVDSTACAALPGAGLAGDGVTATEQANTPLRASTKLVVNGVFSVTTGPSNADRKSVHLYDFPTGAIGVRSVVADLEFSSSSVTDQIAVGVGTQDAVGSTGNGLTSAQSDVVAATRPGALSASLAYQRVMPSARDVEGLIMTRLAATHAIGTSMGDVTWDTEVYKESAFFTFSASSASVTIVEDGLYEIAYDVTAEWVSTAANNAFAAQVVRNGSLITGTGGNDDVLGSAAGRGTISKRFVVALTAGDVIKLQVQRGSASTVRLAADASGLLIRKIAAERSRGRLLDGTATPKSLYLNVGIVSGLWGAAGDVHVTGVIRMDWSSGGAFDA